VCTPKPGRAGCFGVNHAWGQTTDSIMEQIFGSFGTVMDHNLQHDFWSSGEVDACVVRVDNNNRSLKWSQVWCNQLISQREG
jgi:hypothetical protein